MPPWYEIVEGEELQQGDFFPYCAIALPPKALITSNQTKLQTQGTGTAADVPVDVKTYDVVVMSQSCDLVQHKLDLVLVCPYWPMSQTQTIEDEKVRNYLSSPKGREDIRRGYVPAYHMLAESDLDNFRQEIQIVDFRTVFSVPFDYIVELARRRGPRLRLLSPYREHLSQAFARFFMRVGLPDDIPPFK